MLAIERRYDIDYLRVIAIGLLLIYHISIVFQPWGVFIGFIQNQDAMDPLWKAMSLLNVWRIPLLFYVSGMGLGFAMRKRSWKQLIIERSSRILLPFLFGIIAIVPLHQLIWQSYYSQDLQYRINPSHLWFLANIFIYVLILSPLFSFLKKQEEGKIKSLLKRIFSNPIGLLVICVFFIMEAEIIRPESYVTYAMSWHGFFLGFLAFFFGYSIIISGEGFWQMLRRWKELLLAFALVLYSLRLFIFDLSAPGYLMAIESNLWIFAILGFAHKYLNKKSRILSYLSRAAYPVYILHMLFLFLASSLIIPMSISAQFKFILIVIFTTAGCFAAYEFAIRRIKILRPLFGLKKNS